MQVQLKNNWDETLQRFDAWFHNKPTDRPLINGWVHSNKNEDLINVQTETPYESVEERYLNPDKAYARLLNQYRTVIPVAEGFPQFSMNLGAGSMALYLGSEPTFVPETVWFNPFLDNYENKLPLTFDPDNMWWTKHLEIIKRQVELVKGTDIAVCIPDIVENLDILSAIRDPQACCYDLYDYPEEIKQALDDITKLYPIYYNEIYDMVKRCDCSSAYTAFSIVGHGKTAKLQCDFAAMMSPEHFNEFVVPTLENQCEWIDNTMFHLDGPECFPHVDALMAIEKLGALQWTTGARNPRAGDESWYEMYRKVKNAEKGLWLSLADYPFDEAVEIADRLVREFGYKGFYFHFPGMSQKQFDGLMLKAERDWAH